MAIEVSAKDVLHKKERNIERKILIRLGRRAERMHENTEKTIQEKLLNGIKRLLRREGNTLEKGVGNILLNMQKLVGNFIESTRKNG